jgi:hypothetical protein
LKKLSILFALLFTAYLGYAQDEASRSKIKFTDGSELNVLIIENVPGKFIKIQLPGSEEVTIDYKNIVSIKHKSFVYHQKFRLPKGFYMDGSFSLLFGKSSEFSDIRAGIAIGASGNYRFNSYLSLGLGTEFTALFISDGKFMFPVYARIRGSFTEKRVAPVYLVDAGWSFVANDPDSFSTVDGGWFARPALGIRINKFTATVGYQLQQITTTTVNNWWWGGGEQTTVEERLMKNISFSASLMF